MSQDLVVIAIDLDRFQAVFGSRDKRLLESVLTTKALEIAHHDEYFRDWVETGQYRSMREAIEQIVDGRPQRSFQPLFQFEHAAAMLADVMGEPLESDPFIEVKEDFWDEVNDTISECRSLTRIPSVTWPTLDEALARGPLLDVPLDKVRLGTGYLKASEVQAASVAIPENALIPQGWLERLTWPEETLVAMQAYRDWIHVACERERGLFFHR